MRTSRHGVRLALPLAALALLAAGCGAQDDNGPGSVHVAPTPLLKNRTAVSGSIPKVQAAELRTPFAQYRRYVARELHAMQGDVAALKAATAARALPTARAAWLRADGRYESIGAAYGAFGDLDARINGGTAGLPGGERSEDFTGLHRIELALWGRRSVRDAAPFVAALARDVRRLRAKVPGLEIDPLEYTLRAHEVIEGTLDLQLNGRASPWAASAVTALRGNVRGSEVVLRTLAPLMARRNPARLREARQSLDALDTVVTGVAPGTRWDALPLRTRERLSGLTQAAAERLAFVPEVVDVLPPRRPVSPFSGGSGR